MVLSIPTRRGSYGVYGPSVICNKSGGIILPFRLFRSHQIPVNRVGYSFLVEDSHDLEKLSQMQKIKGYGMDPHFWSGSGFPPLTICGSLPVYLRLGTSYLLN